MNFDEKATSWDNEKRLNRAKKIADEIGKIINFNPSNTALEFGCGTGQISFNLYDKFKKITLIDTSKGMIDILNTKIKQNGIRNMVAYHLDINKQNVLKDKFDIIYTSMVFHHILDIESIISKLSELLNDGGYLCIIDLDEEDGSFHSDDKTFEGHNGFNQIKLMNLLKKIGLKEIESHNFYQDIKVIEDVGIKYTLFLMKGKK